MVKRKVSTNGEAPVKATKKVKKGSVTSSIENGSPVGKLDCTSQESLITSILSPTPLQEFFNTYWEKKPFFIKRAVDSFYGSLFTLDAMREMLKEHEMQFELDVNVCRYVDGEKELLNEEGRITNKKFEKLMTKEKATFQVHQPQRFSDGLWNVMEKLETYFGSLVGSNVYITPPNSQGLAPHCDDVEIFVLQLEGKKTWKLYKPMVELSRDYTQDLPQDGIGELIFEQTLEPGDLLYFPRGTIHQAKTTEESHSMHISLSTYQQNTWGDIMNHAVTQAIENALEDDVSIRTGLPINYLSFLGTGKDINKYVEDDTTEENGNKWKISSNENDERVKEFKDSIKKHLSKLIDHIDVNTAADSMSHDFMLSRLPPYGHVVTEDEAADAIVPTLESKIKVRYPDHVRIIYSEEEEGGRGDMSQLDDDESEDEDMEEDERPAQSPKAKTESEEKAEEAKSPKKGGKKKSVKSGTDTEEDEDDEDVHPSDEEPSIKILHSLNNDRERHMCGAAVMSDTIITAARVKLPVHFGKAAIALLESKYFVCVKDLPLEDDDDKLTLAATFYADDLIEIKSN